MVKGEGGEGDMEVFYPVAPFSLFICFIIPRLHICPLWGKKSSLLQKFRMVIWINSGIYLLGDPVHLSIVIQKFLSKGPSALIALIGF